MTLDSARNEIVLYWRGTIPDSLTRQVADERKRGVAISVRSARYTEEQLLRIADRFIEKSRHDGGDIVTVGPEPDASGLRIGSRLSDASVARKQAQGVVARLGEEVPISVRPSVNPRATSRIADTSPFWAGALITIGSPARDCTTGFSVTGLSDSLTYLLTAHHCGTGEFRTGLAELVGRTARVSEVQDAQLIRAESEGWMYDGAAINDTPGQFGKFVAAADSNVLGDFICTSGAYSGAQCLGFVTGVNIRIIERDENGEIVDVTEDLVEAEQVGDPRQPLQGNGDSGGPVFDTGDGESLVAKGTMSLTDDEAIIPCKGIPSSPTRTCSYRIFFGDLQKQMTTLGVRITTIDGE